MERHSLARSTPALWVEGCEVNGGGPSALGGYEEVEDALVEAYYAVPGSCELDELVVGGGEGEGEGEEEEEEVHVKSRGKGESAW